MSAVEKVGVRRARVSLAVAAIFALCGFGAVPANAASPPAFSVLVPIVASGSLSDLITADELTTLVSRGGSWAQLTSAAISHGATIAIDSRIVASIEALGPKAPAFVSAWLNSVTRSRPIYLPWGNADPFVIADSGASYRVSTIQLSEISGVPSADLIGWPTGRAGDTLSLSVVEKLGFGHLIADDEMFPELANAYSSDASATIAEAVAPGSEVDPIAVATLLRDSSSSRLNVVLPRNPGSIEAKRAVAFLNALDRESENLIRFTPAVVTSDTVVTFHDVPSDTIGSLMSQHRLDREASEMALDPQVITIPRLRQLCVIAGLVATSRFPGVVREYTRAARTYEDFVSFSLGSDFTVLANSAELPLTITNTSAADITIITTVNSLSGIVSIPTPNQTITIPSGSSAQVTVPMVSVANGKTSLRATLTTTSGLVISDPVFIEIEVQAQWEGITLVAFIAIVSSIMGIGIARTIRDRRRRS
jgi:hypothetical protein